MFLEICHEEFRFLLKLKLIKQQQKGKINSGNSNKVKLETNVSLVSF